jgi:hypothetical protein
MWDGTIPRRAAAEAAIQSDRANKATWRIACRLYDLGARDRVPAELGKQKYPTAAVKKFQESVGIRANGKPTSETWVKLFGKDKP